MQINIQTSCIREKLAMEFQKWKPVLVILVINFVFAVTNALLKAVLAEGLNHLVIVAYRQVLAALFLAPIAFCLERKGEAKLTCSVLCFLFISALFGSTLSQYLYLLGLQLTSAEFSSAFVNMLPVFTFLMAIPCRQEKVNLNNRSGKAKVLGSVICIGGVLILVLYRGPPLTKPEHTHGSSLDMGASDMNGSAKSVRRWIAGSILLTVSMVSWSSWFVIQGWLCKRYARKYSSTAIISSFGAIQSAIICVALNRDITIWVLHGKLQIITVLFSGIIVSGLCYTGMTWCVEKRGPVFTAAFSPFIQIYVALFDLTFFHEQIFLGSVLGSIVVVSGLYILLWGKSQEAAQAAEVKPLEPANANGRPCPSTRPYPGFIADSDSGCA